jgi:hypothetical protein
MRECQTMTTGFGLWVVLSIAGTAFSPAIVTAQGRGNASKPSKAEQKHDKHDKKADKAGAKHDKAGTIAIDRDGYVRIVRDYQLAGSLPPGLAKREALPPGLRKQLRERGELPPGLQKRLVVVPVSLDRRLPPVPPYYRRYFAGDDLIVVDTRTNLIAAIIRDVWR